MREIILDRNSEYKFPIYKTEIASANILEVKAGTTGFRGGDSGHGCRTYFSIKDLGGTDIAIYPTRSYGYSGYDGVEVLLGGDCELSTIIEGLKFIIQVLEEEKHNETV